MFPSKMRQVVCVCLGKATGYGQRFATKDERPFKPCQEACPRSSPPNANLWVAGNTVPGYKGHTYNCRLLLPQTLLERLESY